LDNARESGNQANKLMKEHELDCSPEQICM